MEVVVPFVKQQKKIKEKDNESREGLTKEELALFEPMTAVEEQFMMEHYDMLLDMFGDYLEVGTEPLPPASPLVPVCHP